jgi:hypothetical protein
MSIMAKITKYLSGAGARIFLIATTGYLHAITGNMLMLAETILPIQALIGLLNPVTV